MIPTPKWLFAFALTLLLFSPATAQTPKELKTKSGVSIVMVNLVNPRPDCSVNPGPVVLPSVKQKPAGGTIQMQIIVVDVAPVGTCPARKLPAIAVIYTPGKEFTGVDLVQLEIDADNRTTSLSYRISVVPQAQSL
jgi:hypothetical protein